MNKQTLYGKLSISSYLICTTEQVMHTYMVIPHEPKHLLSFFPSILTYSYTCHDIDCKLQPAQTLAYCDTKHNRITDTYTYFAIHNASSPHTTPFRSRILKAQHPNNREKCPTQLRAIDAQSHTDRRRAISRALGSLNVT